MVRQTVQTLQGLLVNHSSSMPFCHLNGFPLVSVLPQRVTFLLNPDVQRCIGYSTNPVSNFNTSKSLFLCSKDSFCYYPSEHPIIKLKAKRILLNFLCDLSDLITNFKLNLGFFLVDISSWAWRHWVRQMLMF